MKTNKNIEPELVFINEGFSCYLDAMLTLTAFRDLIQRECSEVLRKHVPELSKAMKVPLDPKQTVFEEVPCLHEQAGVWNSNCIWLQVKLNLRNVTSDLEYLALGLEWNREEDGIVKVEPYTVYGAMSKNTVITLSKKLASDHLTIDPNEYYLAIYGDPAGSNAGIPREEMEWTIAEWVRLWTRVGGVSSRASLSQKV